jgi:hypothetical protein
LTFATPVSAAGAAIQTDVEGAFTAQVTVNGTQTFTENGDSTSTGDGSAIFIGWSGGLITTLQFEVTSPADKSQRFRDRHGCVLFFFGAGTVDMGDDGAWIRRARMRRIAHVHAGHLGRISQQGKKSERPRSRGLFSLRRWSFQPNRSNRIDTRCIASELFEFGLIEVGGGE